MLIPEDFEGMPPEKIAEILYSEHGFSAEEAAAAAQEIFAALTEQNAELDFLTRR